MKILKYIYTNIFKQEFVFIKQIDNYTNHGIIKKSFVNGGPDTCTVCIL